MADMTDCQKFKLNLLIPHMKKMMIIFLLCKIKSCEIRQNFREFCIYEDKALVICFICVYSRISYFWLCGSPTLARSCTSIWRSNGFLTILLTRKNIEINLMNYINAIPDLFKIFLVYPKILEIIIFSFFR